MSNRLASMSLSKYVTRNAHSQLKEKQAAEARALDSGGWISALMAQGRGPKPEKMTKTIWENPVHFFSVVIVVAATAAAAAAASTAVVVATVAAAASACWVSHCPLKFMAHISCSFFDNSSSCAVYVAAAGDFFKMYGYKGSTCSAPSSSVIWLFCRPQPMEYL